MVIPQEEREKRNEGYHSEEKERIEDNVLVLDLDAYKTEMA